MPKLYRVNEVFFSLQGEGVRAGTPNVFVRFSGCNLACRSDAPMGFDCDTEFESGSDLSAEQIVAMAGTLAQECKNVIFTGGEPALQLDQEIVGAFDNWHKAIETNGTIDNPWIKRLDWVCVSPKTAEHTLKVLEADEVKYVRRIGQAVPEPAVKARYKIISPAFEPGGALDRRTLEYCIQLVKGNPSWRLSMQQHKFWGVR